jgi:hypothetical protein
MSASGQNWKQEVSVPCVPPITALTRRMHPLRFAGRFGKADRLLECRLCESAQSGPPAVSDETLTVTATLADAPNVKVSGLLERTRQRSQSYKNKSRCREKCNPDGALRALRKCPI